MKQSLSLKQVIELSGQGNMIPLHTEMPSELHTPISAFCKWSRLHKHSFLFESILGGEKIGRYSFIGCNPSQVSVLQGSDPLGPIEQQLASIQYVQVQGLPEFTGGAVGYISYDCVRYFEPSTNTMLNDSLCIPESIMMYCDSIVIFDHLYSSIKIVSHIFLETKHVSEITEKYAQAWDRILDIVKCLSADSIPLPEQPPLVSLPAESNIGKEGYMQFVTSLKENIAQGDIIQCVPSQRLTKHTNLHPFNAYRTLRTVNPSPYMFYVDFGDFQIVGASPEMLVKCSGNRVETHPIAGTRPRGKTLKEDEEMAQDLLGDIKERSEHIMLVDLGRNDINRVCDPETVQVDSLMHIERYAHVMHIVSCVSGTLRPDQSIFDAFRSVFPAGTLSGAPKVRAMQLIYDLEKEKRGVYGGAVGYFGYNGTMDTCIAIRTMVFKDGKVYMQAGAGIVHDSDPEAEYTETVNKLKSNVVAIEKAEHTYASKEA